MPFIMSYYIGGQYTKIWVSPIVKRKHFCTIIYPFNAKEDISFYTPPHLKVYQPYRNFLIRINNFPFRKLVKSSAVMILIYAFNIYYEILITKNYFLSLILLLVYLFYIWFIHYLLILYIYINVIFLRTGDIQTLDIVRYNLWLHKYILTLNIVR